MGTSNRLVTLPMRRVQYLWCWTSALPMIDWEVGLTLVLKTPYITLMILIGHLMRLPLTKLENIELIIITGLLTLSPLCLLLLVRLTGYTVNLCAFDFYNLIGKLTAFLQLQDFSMHNPTVTSSTSSVWCSSRS